MGGCTGGCPGGGNYSSAKLEGKQWQAATRTPLYLHTFHLLVNFTKLGIVQRPSEAVQLVVTVVIENHLLQLLSRPTFVVHALTVRVVLLQYCIAAITLF